MLGLQGLGSSGGFERLHFLLESAFDGPDLSMAFIKVILLQADLACKIVASYYQDASSASLAGICTGSLALTGPTITRAKMLLVKASH